MSARPIIVITGANAGLGFGTAQRLLVQLSHALPPDTRPDWSLSSSHSSDSEATPSPFAAPNGCTLVLACRNLKKAHAAKTELQTLLWNLARLPETSESLCDVPRQSFKHDEHQFASGDMSARGDYSRDEKGNLLELDQREPRAAAAYRRRFCEGTQIEVVELDLNSMSSALSCASEVTQRYGYITHLVLNAGGAAWIGLDWPLAVWQVLTSLHVAVTLPKYKLQRSGDRSSDGYGWVWQANVGAHYVVTRALLPALRASPFDTPSRIIWTSSIEALERHYDARDPQCLDSQRRHCPYESSKYQCELASIGLSQRLHASLFDRQHHGLQVHTNGVKRHSPESFVVHPGVVASSIFSEFLNVVLAWCMHAAFYFARWTFSPNHPIQPYKGAVAASHVALAPRHLLSPSLRYGSCANFWGQEYVSSGRVDGWSDESSASGLVKKGKEGKEGDVVRKKADQLIEALEDITRDVWKKNMKGVPENLHGTHRDRKADHAGEQFDIRSKFQSGDVRRRTQADELAET
ncbi:NAD(P)-binding protein [Ceraceosorus guamensis]|uniref:NAD(P)-binding protein n=1 Tax=Ceraceosorus guamensis TaxID=1522189 RepID=A0A316WA04_9BASI|nr:NAD(P)-binding protein [Ceraceosorus guamensis]PWN46334.1 NAD(P)-binding protein [Ceraceosorus guamensis]